MSKTRRKRSRTSRQAPPISLIVLLVGFILIAFVFLGFRQVKGAQERRLRLLAGFGERVESTVEDLAERFVRIVGVRAEESVVSDEGDDGEDGSETTTPKKTQNDRQGVEGYLDHVPNISLVGLEPECPTPEDRAGGGGPPATASFELELTGPVPRLRYCPPGEQIWRRDEDDVPRSTDPDGYLARIDLDGLVEPMIVPGAFDSVVLADGRGRTLFQQGEPELRMLSLRALLETAADEGGGELAWIEELLDRPGSTLDAQTFRRLLNERQDRPLDLGARTAMVEVEIAGTEYYVFLQPVSLDFELPDQHTAGEPERWIAAGIISSGSLLSSGLTTSPFLLFVLVSIIPLGIVTWPFLKLSLITRRQPFRRLDLAALLFASVLGIALGALLIFDLLFLLHLHGGVDRQLSALADGIETRFLAEIGDARAQLVALDRHEDLLGDGTVDRCDGRGTDETAPRSLRDLNPVSFVENPNLGGRTRSPGEAATRELITSRVRKVLAEREIDLATYPYFDSFFWTTAGGAHGCSTLPLREAAVLPTNIEDRQYFRCARDCEPEPVFPTGGSYDRAAWEDHADCEPTVLSAASEEAAPTCLQSLLDRTTGQSVTALAIPSSSNDDFPVAALVTRLTSVGHPVLPPGFGFAIVEPEGRVLYHSESRRDLSENFLEAADENPLLDSLVEHRRRGRLSFQYWGQPTRAHVQPIDGLPWSLITFRSTYDLRVRNFELIYDFLNPFLIYLGILSLIAVIVLWTLPARLRRYLWPSSRYLYLYRVVCLASFLLVCLFTMVMPTGSVPWIFSLSFGVPLLLILLLPITLWTVEGRKSKGLLTGWISRHASALETATRERPFVWVVVSVPLVVALIVLLDAGPSLLTTTLLCLATIQGIALCHSWYNFFGARRQVAFTLALGCLLSTLALVPALGFVHLAQSRQAQIHTQDRQLALAQRLQERRQEIAERQSPLQRVANRTDLYEGYDETLRVTRNRYLEAVGVEHREPPPPDSWKKLPLLPWPYAHEDPHEAREDIQPNRSEGRRRAEETVASRVLSARPFPLNDLSARPVESDLSRFEERWASWRMAEDGALLLSYPGHLGVSRETVLQSSTGGAIGFSGGSTIEIFWILLGVMLLLASPFFLAHFLADRVFLITLVGKPKGRRRNVGGGGSKGKRYETTTVASTPLDAILRRVRETGSEDPIRQVVLVSTLPGPSAWKNEVASDELPVHEEGGGPRFHPVSFRTAWRDAVETAEGEEEAPETIEAGDGASSWSYRSELFYANLVPRPSAVEPGEAPEEGEEGEEREEETGTKGMGLSRSYELLRQLREGDEEDPAEEEPSVAPPEEAEQARPRQPILVTHFEPDLKNKEAAEDQVAALQRLIFEDQRSIVILAETVPDPETSKAGPESGSGEPTYRIWAEALASFAVEHGHDSETYDLKDKLSVFDSKFDGLEKKFELEDVFEQDVKSIRYNLRWIARECSPTPLLRRIGHSMVEEIESTLESIEEDAELEFRRVLSRDRRATQERLERLLSRFKAADAADPGEEWRRSDAETLVDVFKKGYEKNDNPGYLVRLTATSLSETGDPADGAELLERVIKALRDYAPSPPSDEAKDENSATTELTDTKEKEQREKERETQENERKKWENTIKDLEKQVDRLGEKQDRSYQSRQRLDHAHSLFQLMTHHHIIAKVGTKARLHYRYLWSTCTTDEKLVLVQLAENGLVNPKYFGWVMDLMNRGLVVRDPQLRVMNESFARFVRQETQRSEILRWQDEEGASAWSVFKWILPAPLVLVAAFLFVTQRDALSNVTGVLVAIVSLAPILVNLYGQFQEVNARREARDEPNEPRDQEAESAA